MIHMIKNKKGENKLQKIKILGFFTIIIMVIVAFQIVPVSSKLLYEINSVNIDIFDDLEFYMPEFRWGRYPTTHQTTLVILFYM